MWVGSAFHMDGPACENTCSSNLVLSRGSRWADVDEDRRSECDCLAAVSCNSVLQISRASSGVYTECIMPRNLHSMRQRTASQ